MWWFNKYRVATLIERQAIAKLFYIALQYFEFDEFLYIGGKEEIISLPVNYQINNSEIKKIPHFGELSNSEVYSAWQQVFFALIMGDYEVTQNALFESSLWGIFITVYQAVGHECYENDSFDLRLTILEIANDFDLFKESIDYNNDEEEYIDYREIWCPKSELDQNTQKWFELIEIISNIFLGERDFELFQPKDNINFVLQASKILTIPPNYYLTGAYRSYLESRGKSLPKLTQAIYFSLFTNKKISNSLIEELMDKPLDTIKNIIDEVNGEINISIFDENLALFSREGVKSYFRLFLDETTSIFDNKGVSWYKNISPTRYEILDNPTIEYIFSLVDQDGYLDEKE